MTTEQRNVFALDIETTLAGERLLDAYQRADRLELIDGWRDLQRTYEQAATRLADDHDEASPIFQLGRLATLVEMAATMATRTPTAAQRRALDAPGFRAVLVALCAGQMTHAVLADAVGSDCARIGLDLERLDELGLVDSRISANRRSSSVTLTLLGEQLLSDWRRATDRARIGDDR